MAFSLAPASHVLWFIPGGWLTSIIVLVVAWLLGRWLDRSLRTDSLGMRLLFLSVGLLIAFTWSVTWWAILIAVAVFIFGWILVWDGPDRRSRVITTLIAVAAVAVVGLHAGVPGTESAPPASAEGIEQQLQGANDIISKDLEQDARLSALEQRVSELEGRVDAVEQSDALQEARLKLLEKTIDGITYTMLPTDISKDALRQLADNLAEQLREQGWREGEFSVGQVAWMMNAYDPGSGTFSTNWVNSRSALHALMREDTDVREHILAVVPDVERDRALSGEGFVPIQFNTGSCVSGNLNRIGGTIQRGERVCHLAGDIVWVYTGPDGTIYWDASVRADCGNPGMIMAPEPNRS